MILDAIVGVITSVLTGMFGLLPAYELSGSVQDAGAQLGGSLAGLNGVVPVGTIGSCLGVLIGSRLFLLVWDVLVWVYDKLPFKAT